MKRAIIIILVLILVGGGGVGGLIMMRIIPNPFNPPKMGTSASMDAAAKAEANLKPFKEPTDAMTLVKMRDMIIPVVGANSVERRVYMSVRLSVVKENKKEIEESIVLYENAVLDSFIPYFQKYFASKNVLDLVEIKAKLNSLAKKIYGEKVIDVLLENVFEQA